jgi:hypothetical protein
MTKNNWIAKAIICLCIITTCFWANAQDWKTERKINVLFGLSQPLLCHGFNVEFNYISKRLIFDFSTGILLKFEGNTLPNELRNQGVDVHMPWTTGFGIGYRFSEWLNLRVEPKYHRFEFYYDNEQKYQSSQITAYNSFTLGLGLYACYLPFKKKENFLKGIMISPSLRYWPTVASTMSGNNFTYLNKQTGSNEEIKTYGPGIGLTALIINVSIGYSFKTKTAR